MAPSLSKNFIFLELHIYKYKILKIKLCLYKFLRLKKCQIRYLDHRLVACSTRADINSILQNLIKVSQDKPGQPGHTAPMCSEDFYIFPSLNSGETFLLGCNKLGNFWLDSTKNISEEWETSFSLIYFAYCNDNLSWKVIANGQLQGWNVITET